MAVIKVKGTQVDIVDISADQAADATAIGSLATGIVADAGAKATFDAEWLTDVVEDTTPQLGADLDLNSFRVVDNAAPFVTVAGYLDLDYNNGIKLQSHDHSTTGGNVFLEGGTGSWYGGHVDLRGGPGGEKEGGNVVLLGGPGGTDGTYNRGGFILIDGGAEGEDTGLAAGGGYVRIRGGVAKSSTNGQSGKVVIVGGAPNNLVSAGGDIEVTASDGGDTGGVGGSVAISAGNAVASTQDGGDITLQAGTTVGGSAGAVVIPTQTAPSVTTDKLYNVAGTLTWNGTDLTAGLLSVAVGDLDNGTDGELITWDASGVAATVPVGTATHILTSNGVGAAPTFQAAPAVGGAGSYTVALVTTTTATAAVFEATMVDDDTAAGVVTITLPAGVANAQQVIKKLGTTANVIIDGDTAETIDGVATFTLTAQYASLTLIWNGTEWSII